MAAVWGIASAGVALATSLGTATPAEGSQIAPLSLTIVMDNYATVPPAVVEQARATATTIFRRINVQLEWWDKTHPDTGVPTDPAAPPAWPAMAIHVRLIHGSAERRRISGRELGFASSGATLATVLVKLVEQLASNRRLDVGELMGVVIAHEIGHLLLPPNSHSAGGLMSPDLDLFRVEHGGLWFDDNQAARIRARVGRICDLCES